MKLLHGHSDFAKPKAISSRHQIDVEQLCKTPTFSHLPVSKTEADKVLAIIVDQHINPIIRALVSEETLALEAIELKKVHGSIRRCLAARVRMASVLRTRYGYNRSVTLTPHETSVAMFGYLDHVVDFSIQMCQLKYHADQLKMEFVVPEIPPIINYKDLTDPAKAAALLSGLQAHLQVKRAEVAARATTLHDAA